MVNYQLSKKAEDDLLQIARYGIEQFGLQQSRHYRDKFKQHFAALAAQPQHYQEVNHIRAGYIPSVCGAHSIYYRIENEQVVIMRVLGRQDPSKQLSN